MATNFKPIDDYDLFHKGLIYGHWGSGKTQFAAGAPDPWWLDLENSTETLRSVGKGSIPVAKIKTMAKFEDALKELCDKSHPCKTIVIDTVNALQRLQMSEWIREQVKKGGASRDIDLPFQIDYRKSTGLLGRYFEMLIDVDKNVLLLAQEKKIYDDSDKTKPPKLIGIKPLLTNALSELVGSLVNFVGYIEVVPGVGDTTKPKRFIHVSPSQRVDGKNRLGIEKSKIENPTFDLIFNKKGIDK